MYKPDLNLETLISSYHDIENRDSVVFKYIVLLNILSFDETYYIGLPGVIYRYVFHWEQNQSGNYNSFERNHQKS